MQRMRSITWGPAIAAWFGLVLVGAWIAGVLALMGSRGYDTSLPVLLGPVLVLVSLPALARQARREESEALFWLLVAALVLKLVSSMVREYVAFDVYEGAADVVRYHEDGIALSQGFRDGNFETGLTTLTSTNFVRFLTGVVYTVIGPSRSGGFLVYSWLGFWGLFFFYRAFTTAVPEGRPRTYARILFFLPSLLFWPSGIGKEAWMMFALGIAAYGAARLLSGATMRGMAGAALGLWLAAVVRPHVAGMAALALTAGYLLRRPRPELRELAPIAKFISIVVLSVVAVFLLFRTDRFLGDSGYDTTAGVASVLGEVGERTGSGGSEFEPTSIVGSPLRAPVGIVTVLFRPSVLEAHNVQSLAAALEGTFLLLLSLTRIRWAFAALHSGRRQPYVVFALVYAGLFVVAFSGVANLGLLARERVQLLPLYLVLFSIPPRKEAEMPEGEDTHPDAWAAERIHRGPVGARRRGTRRDEVRVDVAAAEQVQELQTKMNELEAKLQEFQRSTNTAPQAESIESDVPLEPDFLPEPDVGAAGSDLAPERDPELGVVAPEGDLGRVSGRMAEMLRNVDREVEQLRRNGAEEAARIVAGGKVEAERLRAEAAATKDEARITADRVLREARAEAARTISSLAEQRDQIVADLVSIRARVTAALEDLRFGA